jgi:hypothetical protein
MSHLFPSLSALRDSETEYQSTRSRLSRREKLRLSVLSEPQKVEVCRPWEPMRSAADILLYGSGSFESQEPYIPQPHCHITSCFEGLCPVHRSSIIASPILQPLSYSIEMPFGTRTLNDGRKIPEVSSPPSQLDPPIGDPLAIRLLNETWTDNKSVSITIVDRIRDLEDPSRCL